MRASHVAAITLVLLLGGQTAPATAAPATGDAPDTLASSLQAGLTAKAAGDAIFESWRNARPQWMDEHDARVVIEVHEGESGWEAAKRLSSTHPNLMIEESSSQFIQARIPWEDLVSLASSENVKRVREPIYATPKKVFTEGYDVMFFDDWHAAGAKGRRMDVAVLDVDFTHWKERRGSELPWSVDTSFRSNEDIGGDGHGTAVAEIIHDIAPKADLKLYGFGTDVEFLAALEEIADDGMEVVNASVGFDNVWPADGTSPYTKAVDALIQETGTAWIAAAGNEQDRYRVGALADAGDDWVSVAGNDEIWVATWGGWGEVSFRWDDSWGEATVDLDLYLFDESGSQCGKSVDPQDGDDNPLESAWCETNGDWIFASIANPEGVDVSGLSGWLYTSNYLEDSEWSADMSGTLTLPGDTVEGITVGAVDIPNTDEVAYYSSRGPTEDGRIKPEIVAPASTSTETYGQRGFPGTSCAAPHATGVAALVLGANKRQMDPEALREWMQENTTDIESEGVDDRSGYGLLTPGDIPWNGCHCAATGTPKHLGLGLGLVLAIGISRRRRGLG